MNEQHDAPLGQYAGTPPEYSHEPFSRLQIVGLILVAEDYLAAGQLAEAALKLAVVRHLLLADDAIAERHDMLMLGEVTFHQVQQ